MSVRALCQLMLRVRCTKQRSTRASRCWRLLIGRHCGTLLCISLQFCVTELVEHWQCGLVLLSPVKCSKRNSYSFAVSDVALAIDSLKFHFQKLSLSFITLWSSVGMSVMCVKSLRLFVHIYFSMRHYRVVQQMSCEQLFYVVYKYVILVCVLESWTSNVHDFQPNSAMPSNDIYLMALMSKWCRSCVHVYNRLWKCQDFKNSKWVYKTFVNNIKHCSQVGLERYQA